MHMSCFFGERSFYMSEVARVNLCPNCKISSQHTILMMRRTFLRVKQNVVPRRSAMKGRASLVRARVASTNPASIRPLSTHVFSNSARPPQLAYLLLTELLCPELLCRARVGPEMGVRHFSSVVAREETMRIQVRCFRRRGVARPGLACEPDPVSEMFPVPSSVLS